jgi:hypothetical protein
MGKMPEGRCSVDFVDQAEFHVLEFEMYDDDERDLVWYTREEYDIIKARNSLIIKMMKAGTFEESNEHSFRGLEHKLKDGFKKRRHHKFAALNAVLEEQDKQYNKSSIDQEIIASAYREVAFSAREAAYENACRDIEGSYSYTGTMPTPTRFDGHMSFQEEEELPIGDTSDIDTVCSEDTRGSMRKSRMGRFLENVKKNKEGRTSKMRRRVSM